jgi:two-component system, LytTR family, response regulator
MLSRMTFKLSSTNQSKFLVIVMSACLVIIAVAIFQDFLQSRRNGNSFFFFESLLFKVLWIYFPPILLLLKSALEKYQCKTILQTCFAVMLATLVHITLVPITIWCLSAIFRDQSYGIVKTLTFTLSNDLVKLLLVYGAFVLLLRYLETREKKEAPKESVSLPQYLTVGSGKDNTRIKLDDILYIKAATPYIEIHTQDKQYLHSESLKSIINKLDSRFIRVHRSFIVYIDKVESYKSRLNGDYDLTLQNGTQIRLSRNYVSEFKKRFEPCPQLNQ